MTPTKAQIAESFALMLHNLEALRHKADGDAELDAELVAMKRLAFAAFREASTKEATS
jgi:hypothetical protein